MARQLVTVSSNCRSPFVDCGSSIQSTLNVTAPTFGCRSAREFGCEMPCGYFWLATATCDCKPTTNIRGRGGPLLPGLGNSHGRHTSRSLWILPGTGRAVSPLDPRPCRRNNLASLACCDLLAIDASGPDVPYRGRRSCRCEFADRYRVAGGGFSPDFSIWRVSVVVVVPPGVLTVVSRVVFAVSEQPNEPSESIASVTTAKILLLRFMIYTCLVREKRKLNCRHGSVTPQAAATIDLECILYAKLPRPVELS
jgi:hypothetical protein